MAPNRRLLILFALGVLVAGARAGQANKTRIDPFPLRFPLVEAGTLEFEGHLVGQPSVGDGIVYFATREGYRTAVVVPSRSVLWRKPVEGSGPGPVGPAEASAEPESPPLKVEGSMLTAIDGTGGKVWEFAAEGAIDAAPAVHGGRVYFGAAERMFYCLSVKTGKKVWSRRLQGSALHPAVFGAGVVAVAASNSVVYRLSAKGGSILSWEAVPSRIVYELDAAGPLVLISSASPTLTALDLRTGKRAGQYEASGSLAAGAVWSPPFVVLFVADEASGRQRIVFLRSR